MAALIDDERLKSWGSGHNRSRRFQEQAPSLLAFFQHTSAIFRTGSSIAGELVFLLLSCCENPLIKERERRLRHYAYQYPTVRVILEEAKPCMNLRQSGDLPALQDCLDWIGQHHRLEAGQDDQAGQPLLNLAHLENPIRGVSICAPHTLWQRKRD